MTPAARLAAVIELLSEMEDTPRRPADAVANEFFRKRRFIGSADRRDVSGRVWQILRQHRRLSWWIVKLNGEVSPRLLVAASLAFEGKSDSEIEGYFSGADFAPPPLRGLELKIMRGLVGQKLQHPHMPPPVRLDLPDWLYPLLELRFGDKLDEEVKALAEPAPLDLRVNILKGNRDEARIALGEDGFRASFTDYSPWGLRLPPRQSITNSKAFQTGLVEIQDEGSQLVAMLADAKPGLRVLDWCAGAGGKTLAIAACMNNRGFIAACDVSEARLEGAVRRLRRAGVHNVERHLVKPGDKWAKRRVSSFDRVLVDAPCTGSGTWRRNPDARLRLREQDLAELLPKQKEILATAATMVKPGGKLIYATCSLLAEENDLQIADFLSTHKQFRVVPISESFPGLLQGSTNTPYLALTPRQHGTDGFFTAVLLRDAPEKAPAEAEKA